MGEADDPPPGEIQWIDAGTAPPERDVIDLRPDHKRPWHWWYWLIAAAVLALIAFAVRPDSGKKHDAGPSTTVRPSPSSPPASASESIDSSESLEPPPSITVTPVVVTEAGHALLDVPASWQLFAYGPGAVVRVGLKLGHITTTAVDSTDAGTPVALLVGTGQVLVQPLDSVAGYVVADGKPPKALPYFFQQGEAAIPGPDQGHLWLPDDQNPTSVHLVDFAGHKSGTAISLPYGLGSPSTDGAGYLLYASVDGTYDVRPGTVTRVTTGSLLAIGPTRWLAIECDDHLRCALNVIDHATFTHRTISTDPKPYVLYGGGVISPDGKTAALIVASGDATATVHLLDLNSGQDVATSVTADRNIGFGGNAFVWSPDSRWVFVADANGRAVAIDRNSHRGQVITLPTVPITQLALRIDG